MHVVDYVVLNPELNHSQSNHIPYFQTTACALTFSLGRFLKPLVQSSVKVKKVYIVFCLHTPDALKELSKKYNERTQVFEDFHIGLHELSPLEVLKEFIDLYKC